MKTTTKETTKIEYDNEEQEIKFEVTVNGKTFAIIQDPYIDGIDDFYAEALAYCYEDKEFYRVQWTHYDYENINEYEICDAFDWDKISDYYKVC